MHRSVYVSIVLIPLVLALSFLIFAICTEYWTKLDYSKISRLDRNLTHINEIYNKKYEIKKLKFEFPKYTSLFGECDEFKQIEILLPIENNQDDNKQEKTNHRINTKYLTEEETDENLPLRMFDYDTSGCMSKHKCYELNLNEPDSCFCCSSKNNHSADNCCFLKSKLCDGVANCKDRSDELDNCPIRKLYYSSRYYDNKHNCLRHQYNLINFIRNVIGQNFTEENEDNDFCLRKLIKSNSYTVRIFVLRVLTLFSFATCILFTILSIISIIFVSCCYGLKEKHKHEHDSNEFIEDYDESSINNKKSKCCKCNCLLCPFVFYSFFSLFALLSCLFGLCVYLYTLCYVHNAYLIFDFEFIPEHITQAYQNNSWLFSIQRFGISFYALLISFMLYLLVFILSTCVSCRIQMSPAWKTRHSTSYEVLRMQDIMLNSNGKKYNSKSYYKKISKENKKEEKEAKKIGKKYKNKDKNEEGFSLNDESQTLTAPRAKLATMDEDYE